ncbi:tRNA (adenosine(37)-N6)-threonylcarbamoyltransferase complex transferase subunit TsaD [Carboxydothermus ferrireducens]|uniref:N(6)-L-threonylcarbamoyladenine synthase n=1 Tax=Carboxydothermus ferrireducens DSM 11255 TaxID=1119529 RepID=A0ABX2RFR0_9THEO|nr:hypothetical protein [Carboxydothermus ferrireducens]NYE58705.1 N6-L-threonylcarbamoyladenine synthase [Carboxydothermus ferrireducens DSM 11255]
MRDVFLGFDTSNYTTSFAAVDGEGRLIFDLREILPVPEGEVGLRQRDVVFLHLRHLKEMVQEGFNRISRDQVRGIGVSVKPRPLPESYMPSFLAGEVIASTLSLALDVPLVKTTHQEGHLVAALWSLKKDFPRFLAIHFSGGTSEILEVEKEPQGYKVKVLGKSLDISAGQLVDRIGVLLGLPFPSGKFLEELAQKAVGILKVPATFVNGNWHFSGAEAYLKRKLKDFPAFEIARAVEEVIARTLFKIIQYHAKDNLPVVLMGGVAANNYIKNFLLEKLKKRRVAVDLYFAEVQYASDNAVGVAEISRISRIFKISEEY